MGIMLLGSCFGVLGTFSKKIFPKILFLSLYETKTFLILLVGLMLTMYIVRHDSRQRGKFDI